MRNWLLRGLVFAALMVVVRLIQGVLINAWQSQAGLISSAMLLLFVIAVVAWGLVDGRTDATATPDPDRRQDLAMTWLSAGLLAGALGGLVAWVISLFYRGLYVGGLISEVSTFAAFTALLVFVPAVAAVAIGRRLVDRNYTKQPQHHHGLAADGENHAHTDVFAAVGAGVQEDVAAEATAADAAVPAAALGGEAPGFTIEEFPTDVTEPAQSTAPIPASAEETTAVIPPEGEDPDQTRG